MEEFTTLSLEDPEEVQFPQRLKEGWLKQQTMRRHLWSRHPIWQRRYFILERQTSFMAQLSWFSCQPSDFLSSLAAGTRKQRALGTVALDSTCSVDINAKDESLFELKVPAKERTLILRVEEMTEKEEWAGALHLAIMARKASKEPDVFANHMPFNLMQQAPGPNHEAEMENIPEESKEGVKETDTQNPLLTPELLARKSPLIPSAESPLPLLSPPVDNEEPRTSNEAPLTADGITGYLSPVSATSCPDLVPPEAPYPRRPATAPSPTSPSRSNSVQQLSHTMNVIAEQTREIERLRNSVRTGEEKEKDLVEKVAALEGRLSTEHFQLTRLGFVKKAADVENAKRIAELESALSHLRRDTAAVEEAKRALSEKLQLMDGEFHLVHRLLGCTSGDRVEKKLQERLESWERQSAEWHQERLRLEEVCARQADRIRALGQEKAEAILVPQGPVDKSSGALESTAFDADTTQAKSSEMSGAHFSSSLNTNAREAELEEELHGLRGALAETTRMLVEAQQQAAEFRETSDGLQKLWWAQDHKVRKEDPEQGQEPFLPRDLCGRVGGSLPTMAHDLVAILGELEARLQKGGSLSASPLVFDEGGPTCCSSTESETSRQSFLPEDLSGIDGRQGESHLHEPSTSVCTQTSELEPFERLTHNALHLATVLARKVAIAEAEMTTPRRRSWWPDRPTPLAQHCMRLREMTQAVSAKATAFVAHAEALLRTRNSPSLQRAPDHTRSTGSGTSSNGITGIQIGAGGVGRGQSPEGEGFGECLAPDSEILRALHATKAELEDTLRAQFEAHSSLEDELISQQDAQALADVSNSSASKPGTMPAATTEWPTGSSYHPCPSPSPTPLSAPPSEGHAPNRRGENEGKNQRPLGHEEPHPNRPASLPHYYPIPDASSLRDEEKRLKTQRRRLVEERKRMEAVSAQLAMQRRSIDDCMLMLSDQVAISRKSLDQRKKELQTAGSLPHTHTSISEKERRTMSSQPCLSAMAETSAAPQVPASSLSLLKRKANTTREKLKARHSPGRDDERQRISEKQTVRETHEKEGKPVRLQETLPDEDGLNLRKRTGTLTDSITPVGPNGVDRHFDHSKDTTRLQYFEKEGTKLGLTRSKKREKPLLGKADMIRFTKEIGRLEQRLSEEKSVAARYRGSPSL